MRYKRSCREKEIDRKLEMADAAPDAEEPEVVYHYTSMDTHDEDRKKG
jgi:hypothetical protein